MMQCLTPVDNKSSNILPGPCPLSHEAGNGSKFWHSWNQSLILRSLILFVTALSLWISTSVPLDFTTFPGIYTENARICPQEDPLVPQDNLEVWENLGDVYNSTDFKIKAVNWLGGAVRVPTETFDTLGSVLEDERWEVFKPFHNYLEDTFPKVHSTLRLTKVNTYGLLYTWSGSDTTLKPLVLMGHQDVVPVDPTTAHEWTHPPYSGHFDGENIWGRGSSDDKSGVIGIMSSVEMLIKRGFQPKRTVVLSFGFDEEISGEKGARELYKVLLEDYGEDGVAMIVDEGGNFYEKHGTVFASLGIAEKGYIDVSVEVTSPGGHSSMPPKHTTIGILAALLVHYEAHPSKPRVTRKDPFYHMTQCVGAHAVDIPCWYRNLIKLAAHSDNALRMLNYILFRESTNRNFVGTTQAIDLIKGGVKVNALPEQAQAVINHRIAVTSSVKETQEHAIRVLEPFARKFNLSCSAFERNHVRNSASGAPNHGGKLILSNAFGDSFGPAPITPVDAIPYKLMSGTIRATYNAHRGLGKITDRNIFVSPGMPTGNTDTKFYWALTRHIFRYNHSNAGNATDGRVEGIHTVNEHIGVDAFLEKIRFFTTLILNVDETVGM